MDAGDVGDDAYTQPETYVCLNDICIARRKRHVRGEPRLGESIMQGRRAREAEHVGYDWMRGEVLQGRLAERRQGMPVRHDDASMPPVTRQQDILAKQFPRARRDGEVDAIELGHFRDLLGSTLVQVELHIGIPVAEGLDDRRQDITRLCVGGSNGQRAAVLVGELGRNALDVFCLTQQFQCVTDDPAPRAG